MTWLLKDLSHVALEGDIADRERAIQSGRAHYAESLPVEFQPDEEYQKLFRTALSESADRLATAIGAVTDLLITDRVAKSGATDLTWCRWPGPAPRWNPHAPLGGPHPWARPAALHHLDRPGPRYRLGGARLSFPGTVRVGGVRRWLDRKGRHRKGTHRRTRRVRGGRRSVLSDDLAVLADPGYCVRTFGTRDDFLIASACLNSTVSGWYHVRCSTATTSGPENSTAPSSAAT